MVPPHQAFKQFADGPLERERISERTHEGLVKAAEQGRKGGRREVTATDPRVRRAKELAANGLTRAEIEKAMGVSAQTVWRWLRIDNHRNGHRCVQLNNAT